MDHKQIRSWISQLVLFFILVEFFSALPLVLALLLDKSGLGLALFTIWYALIPPAALVLLSWFLYRKERRWISFAGRVWIGVGIWFLVQYVLGLASGIHVIVALLRLPALTVGGVGFLAGAMLFLIGGIALALMGRRVSSMGTRPLAPTWNIASTVALLALILVGLPIFVLLTTRMSPSPVESAWVPTEDKIFSWIEDIYNFGVRRPGSEADLQAIEYLQGKLREFGFNEVNEEHFTFDYWEPVSWNLTVQSEAGASEELVSFYVPYSGPTGPEGITAEVVYVRTGSEDEFADTDVAGKVILVDIPSVDISWDQMSLFSFMAFDPDGTAEGWKHPYPLGWMLKYLNVYKQAAARGAVGIIGVLQDYPDMEKFTYYAPFDGVLRPIPGLYVKEDDGERLKAAIKRGSVSVRLVLEAKVAKDGGKTATVYGVLPGRSNTNIIIHSHHDAPWRGGVEDSSGVGMVLSLARYFSQVPKERRNKTLIFMFTGSHMVGSPSNVAFIEKHRDGIMSNMLFDVCIEHIADDYNPPAPPTGLIEPRGVFITENSVAISLYAQAIARHDMYRTILFPTGTPLGAPNDAGAFHIAGYPIISFISGPVWLFDDDDTLERVARDQLVPLTEMYIDFISQLDRVSNILLRFNLNVWTILLVALVLTPLAVLSTATRRYNYPMN